MNALNNFDITDGEYSPAHTDDFIRFWRSKIKVMAGRWGGDGVHIDTGALKSIVLIENIGTGEPM